MRKLLILAALLLTGAAASAQLPGLRKRTGPPTQPLLQGIDALRADFAAQSGGTTVYFGAESVGLAAPARTVLAAQAGWLRRHARGTRLASGSILVGLGAAAAFAKRS